MSPRKPPEEGDSSEEAKDLDILESQDTSDWLVKSSALNPGRTGRFSHDLEPLPGNAGLG